MTLSPSAFSLSFFLQTLLLLRRQIKHIYMTIKAFWKLLQDFCVMGRFMALPAVRNFAMFVMALGTVNLAMEACRSRPFLEHLPMTRATGGIGCF